MFDDALAAAGQILTPPFRRVLLKTIALTLALLGLVWIGLEKLIVAFVALPYPWLSTALSFLGGLGLFIGLAFLLTPASFLVAGFFFDELAEEVERELNPKLTPGRALPFGEATWLSLKFAAVSLLVNLVALALLLVPGVNAVAFFGANAYLFGRGYFELAALRFLPFAEVRRLRRDNELRLFVAGLFMAGMLAFPVFNLLTPLFGAAFMVRVGWRIMKKPIVETPWSNERGA
ncbi:sulfate transporter family protein [Methylocapsa acidiphila]|uniref:sulfate transporter family protein n=1 Tax=Methylocapsa acidiphila TaxID=133552 RepID=UPI000416747E|nr:sulfate transporter family protein [Methylocapsa acidiphila]